MPPMPPPSGERRLAVRGIAWGGVESATSVLVGLFLTPLVVSRCGLSGLGLWSASWSLAHATNMLDLGVGASYTRFTSGAIARDDLRGLNRILGAGTAFHLILGILVAAVACLIGPTALGIIATDDAAAGVARTVFACTLGTVLLRTLLSAYRGVLAGAQRIDRLGRIGATVSVLEGCGAALALLCGRGLSGMAINSLLFGVVASIAEGIAAHRLVPGLRVVPFVAGRDEWRELLSFGLRLQIVRASEIAASHAPRLALAAGAGLAPAGLYDLGARVAGALQIAALPLPVIQPLAGRLFARGEGERLRLLLRSATRYVSLLALPCAALILLDPQALLLAWTGRMVPAEASATARILAPALACALLVSPLRLVLRGCGRPGPEALAAFCGAVLQVGLACALAERLGPTGVAVAALTASVVSAALLLARAKELRGLALRVLPPTLAAASAGFVAGAVYRLAVPGWEAACATRADALAHLLPEGILLAAGTLSVAFLTGALARDEAFSLLATLLPGRTAAGLGKAAS
jgi:O-antigen/teichoic acid export membrane protein